MRLSTSYLNVYKNFTTSLKPKIKLCISNHLQTVRDFHATSILRAKSHQEKENEYAHSVMSNINSYSDTLVRYPLKILNDSKDAFSEVTTEALQSNLSLEHGKYTQLTHRLAEILPQLSDSDLLKILHNLCLWPPSPKPYSPNFKILWNKLDSECLLRLKSWNTNFKLLVADYWFCLRLNRISQYNKGVILNLFENLDSLSDTQIVQLMFYINLQRQFPPNYVKHLEKRLPGVINSVSIEEVGVICLGFFKTETKVSDFNVIKTIIKRFSSEVKTVNTLTVNAILKFLKKSLHMVHTDNYVELLHTCSLQVSGWDIPTSLQLLLLSTTCNVYNPSLFDRVTEKLLSTGLEGARIKDCVKLLQCLSQYNHSPGPKFQESFFTELQKESRQPEFKDYPRDLAYSTLYYAYLGHYNYDLLRTILNPDFTRYCRWKCPETKHVLPEIDYCIEIECEDYVGPRLPKRELEILRERRGNLPSEVENVLARLLKEVSLILESLLSERENLAVRHILPHFYSPDIIVRSSSTLIASDAILRPPPGERWTCFVLSSPFSFAFKSRHVTGVTAMKLRQLQKVGYRTVFIPFYELPTNREAKKKYLKHKLEQSYKSKIPVNL